MAGIVFGEGLTLRGPTPSESMQFTVVENPTIVSPSETPFTDRDADFAVISGALTENNFNILASESLVYPGAPEYSSETPDVAAVDSAGRVTRVSNGAARILAHMPKPLGTRVFERTMVGSGTLQPANYFKNYVTGSLGKHISDAVFGMVDGLSPGDATQNFLTASNNSLTSPSVTRNPNLFASALDLSAISVLNDNYAGAGTYMHPAMLISPRHVIGSTHFQPGATVVFLTPGGEYRTARIILRQNHVGGAEMYNGLSDVQVAYLDTEITGITPFKFLPSNWRNYLPTAYREVPYGTSEYKQVKIPCLAKTAHRQDGSVANRLGVTEVIEMDDGLLSLSAMVVSSALETVLPTRAWYATAVGGDSGGPLIVPVDGEAVLLSAYWTGGGGSNYAGLVTHINAAMNALAAGAGDPDAGTYAVQTVDLSGFTSYP